MAFMAGATELLGGFLFASGIFIVVGSLFIVGTMLMAIFTVHGKNGYWVTQNGYEYNLMLIAVAVGVALIGHGHTFYFSFYLKFEILEKELTSLQLK